MAGLTRSGGAFITYIAVVYLAYLTLSAFFKFLGAISVSYDTAGKWANLVIIWIVLYSGYMIQEQDMRNWQLWVCFASQYSALSSLRSSNSCEGPYIVPNGPGYPTKLGLHQICSLRGSPPGSQLVSGADYIRAQFQYEMSSAWRDFGIMCVYFIFFTSCLFLAVEFIDFQAGMPAINVFSKENAERKKLNETLQANKEKLRKGASQKELKGLITSRKPFTWEALTYDVKVPEGKRRLLNEVYGYVKPGTLTALMGSSGAGKTTLLDVLANRKTTGVIQGDIKIGGMTPGVDFQRGTGYCEQQDVHEWTATVREAFRFSAYLRQPADISLEEKNAYVEQLIQLLEMEDLADGVEARKRVTIGVELAAKPQLLLFLDEPTTGLDGQSAYNIVRFLRKLASAGQAILCTIHQPNALLFENFDRLLLLKSGGRCVYFGDIGKDSHVIREYFRRNGAVCPQNANPAEFMLEAIARDTWRQVGGKTDWADRWLESPEHEENKRMIAALNGEIKHNQKDRPQQLETVATQCQCSAIPFPASDCLGSDEPFALS
ncbi:hypothetical protein O181_026264 [Austropuccinia psidii MF-1]|uniref:ABC transporter domain-containing protein n=1 Tax=Austropuccinia psidii MF-1 TaxID=1389203 RepID=A0A9Q3H1G3_9BASI|nr:hypothetical protein [Austropuccinia psidii MF-1]